MHTWKWNHQLLCQRPNRTKLRQRRVVASFEWRTWRRIAPNITVVIWCMNHLSCCYDTERTLKKKKGKREKSKSEASVNGPLCVCLWGCHYLLPITRAVEMDLSCCAPLQTSRRKWKIICCNECSFSSIFVLFSGGGDLRPAAVDFSECRNGILEFKMKHINCICGYVWRWWMKCPIFAQLYAANFGRTIRLIAFISIGAF